MLPNLVLKLDKPYTELRQTYSKNLIRNLKKSDHSAFYIIKNDDPKPLIKLFREEKGPGLAFLKDENYLQLTRVVQACLDRNKAKVWSVYNQQNELCAGAVWLYNHGKAVFYFSAQSKTGRSEGAMAWLIDAFICEHASSGETLDFEGSANPGLARFYGSFGSVLQPYPRIKINRLSPVLKMMYAFYRKIKKD
jgi:hypothetical protein